MKKRILGKTLNGKLVVELCAKCKMSAVKSIHIEPKRLTESIDSNYIMSIERK